MLKLKQFITYGLTFLCTTVFGQSVTINYNSNNIFTVGMSIPTLGPAVTGGTVTSFSISPTLPAGLAFNNITGVITGTPLTVNAATNYTVSGIVGGNAIVAKLMITVNNPLAPIIAYPTPNTLNVNQQIPTIKPTVVNAVNNYSISPALPAGLVIDPITGYITGTPTGLTALSKFTVTASNGPVSGSFDLYLSVVDQDAPKITYNTPNIFIANSAIGILSPTVSGGTITTYTVSPALPTGLTINPSTGVISGLPSAASGHQIYVVAGTYASGTHYANIEITVNPAIPGNDYNTPVANFLIDTIIKPIKPLTIDPHSYYTVDTPLPDGLRLNPQTGEITGTPTTASAPNTYKITAHNVNTKDNTDYNINLSVSPRQDAIITPSTITFVGQGDIQQSLNSNTKIAANTGIGVVFRQNSNTHFGILHDIEVDFSINVASTVDTIKSVNNGQNVVTNKQDFGNSVLLPSNSGQAFSFNFKGYFTKKSGDAGNFRRNEAAKPLGGVLSGFNISLNGSNRNWEYVDSIKTVTPTLVKTSLLSLYVGPFYEFYMPTVTNGFNRNVSITIGAGYSGRWVLGDIQQSTQSNLRSQLLGTTQNSFNGYEVLLSLRFYNIKAEVHLPFFSNKNPAPGLTGTHMTTFIGFSGGFPIDLTKPSSGS